MFCMPYLLESKPTFENKPIQKPSRYILAGAMNISRPREGKDARDNHYEITCSKGKITSLIDETKS